MTGHQSDDWRFVHIGFEAADVDIGGVNPWAYEWHSEHAEIRVPHPTYPSQRHRLHIWSIATTRGRLIFAAGELSNGVWCFYEPVSA